MTPTPTPRDPIPAEQFDAVLDSLFANHHSTGQFLMGLSGRRHMATKVIVEGQFQSGHLHTVDEDLYNSAIQLFEMSTGESAIRRETGEPIQVTAYPIPLPARMVYRLCHWAITIVDRLYGIDTELE